MASKFPEFDRDLVTGFIRLHYNKDALKMIPKDVQFTCLLFYHGAESFEYYDEKKIRTSKNRRIITNVFGKHSTAYGCLSIPYDSKGIHVWIFKILKHNGNDWGDIAIGIDESIRKWKHSYFCPRETTQSYGYGSTGVKGNKRGIEKFAEKYSANDVITMTLNLKTKQLLFKKNNEETHCAFTLTKTHISYSAAVCLMGVCDSVSLVSYQWIDKD